MNKTYLETRCALGWRAMFQRHHFYHWILKKVLSSIGKWEKTLNQGNWSMVTWPKEYGGRGLDLIQW